MEACASLIAQVILTKFTGGQKVISNSPILLCDADNSLLDTAKRADVTVHKQTVPHLPSMNFVLRSALLPTDSSETLACIGAWRAVHV